MIGSAINLNKHAEHWVDIKTSPMACRPHDEYQMNKIDVLVELGGFTGQLTPRLPCPSLHAAIQTELLGLPRSDTYLKCIDGWIGDEDSSSAH